MSTDMLSASLRRMADSLVHRGPDDVGYYLDPHIQLGLGFRRLAIQDLSPAGHQPMASTSGRYIIVFNGEIYNFRELRAQLDRFHPSGCDLVGPDGANEGLRQGPAPSGSSVEGRRDR